MANMISNHNSGSGNGGNSSNNTIDSSSGSNYSNLYHNLHSHSVRIGGGGGRDSGNSSGSGSGGGVSEVQTLRDVCNMLNGVGAPANYMIPTGGCAYDHIIAQMRGLDLQDDGIILNSKIKTIETDFCNIVRDESMLCESMEYMNEKALGDGETALKFALLFSSRNFDALAMKETKVRSAMLKILETNFINADAYRQHDKNRLYNSITLLGEYYHRVRLADNAPITILGESLLSLLTREINDTAVVIHTRLARLILSQITLNGEIMRTRHKAEIDLLLYHIRRHLIMQPALTPKVKAMLLMVLDLFYSHFKHVGTELEAMYTDYLIGEEGEGDGEEDSLNNNAMDMLPQPVHLQSPKVAQSHDGYTDSHGQATTASSSGENGSSANDSFEVQPTTKKWSEQVLEESFCDIDGYGETELEGQDFRHNSEQEMCRESGRIETSSNRPGRRGLQLRNSPRPLRLQQQQQHQTPTEKVSPVSDQYQVANSEDRDETKPLPSWRKTRFNRANNDTSDQPNGRSRNSQRRYSGSFDDDHHSVRSDGGNMRLYSIHDRRKRSQERFERNLGTNYNSIVNSNWDQRDDRSERSYMSNYERGNSYKRGGRFNNRNTYDKPPRFQKQHQQHQQNQQRQQASPPQGNNQKIHSETWRRSNTAINSSSGTYQDENCAFNSNGPESNSRSSSRARTLPRPPKSQMTSDDGGNRKQNAYRFSQSPSSKRGSGNGPRNYNSRYSSQSSLASEASSTFDRRQHPNNHPSSHQQQQQRHRNFTRRSQPDIHQPNAENWPAAEGSGEDGGKADESELVRNAQQTTRYMNYLSSQK